MTDPAKSLRDLVKTKEFFVGIDSDGCVFDSMGIKQRECFCPWYIGYFGLQPVAEAARECKEFADLFSKTRGLNRHKTIELILSKLLPTHPQVKERGFKVPEFKYYCEWVNNHESLLSNEGLKAAAEKASCEEQQSELLHCLKWSEKVNETVHAIVKNVPPFPYVRESLEKIQNNADVIVCSQTPTEALEREWQEHDVDKYVQVIAGQEMGTKAQHLGIAIEGKYDKAKVLMIGDAPGDQSAAQANGVLFFPILPHDGAESWKRFYEEAFDKFLNGEYAGSYQQQLIEEFHAQLPEYPSWN